MDRALTHYKSSIKSQKATIRLQDPDDDLLELENMIKNKGGGRNCEPNVHFESFYPSDVINEEGRTGDESGPALGAVGSIDGADSGKIDDARDCPDSSNNDCSESMRNLRCRLGLADILKLF